MRLTRRFILGGLLSGAAQAALANAPDTSIRPAPRAPDFYKRAIDPVETLVARARLGGSVSFAVADARSGQVLEARAPLKGHPPASTAKAITAMYALDVLGRDHRFRTRLVATGPVENGRVQGDLVLVGSGDPVLDTDALAGMVARLKDAGVREVAGRFRVWAGVLPELNRIDAEQPEHVGYNPALGGLNLNFNRVHFGWEKSGTRYKVTMEARTAKHRPEVSVARMQVVDRRTPIYTYEDRDGRDHWTVARAALGQAGARWLPVRRPAIYTGQVFSALARAQGIVVGQPVHAANAPAGQVLVTHESVALHEILRGMLKYSTNSTAEIVGLAASAARGPGVPASLVQSAERMNAWLAEYLDDRPPAFEDHSGLGDDSRISARTMVQAMVRAGANGDLRGLMKAFPVQDLPDAQVQAKTGTLNFVNALTGFVAAPDGTDLAFAIFCSDTERRDALPMAQREKPEGGASYANRARTLQRGLIERWAMLYGSGPGG